MAQNYVQMSTWFLVKLGAELGGGSKIIRGKMAPQSNPRGRRDTLVAEIRPFGRVPQLTDGKVAQDALADRWRWAKRRGQLSDSHGAGQPVLKVPRTGSEHLPPESELPLAPTAASQPASSQR